MAGPLDEIAREVAQGRTVQPVTVRQFLRWFGHQRRGYWIVREVREELAHAGLVTDHDFETAWLDAEITFLPFRQSEATSREDPDSSVDRAPLEDDAAPGEAASWVTRDPTYRLSKLPAANQQIISIKPDGTLAQAVTIMLARDFSQLPVMTNEREVKGIITWKTIGSRLALNGGATFARDLMEPHHEISAQRSLFDAIQTIVTHQYVLVRAPDRMITGIITASDLSLQFRALAEPFLLLSEIENLVRSLIADHFGPAELAAARDPSAADRAVETVADLTFGEYVRLLEKPERWGKLKLAADRGTFCQDLDQVRRIRNDVMHFDPDGVPPDDLERLREFTNFLKELQVIASTREAAKASGQSRGATDKKVAAGKA